MYIYINARFLLSSNAFIAIPQLLNNYNYCMVISRFRRNDSILEAIEANDIEANDRLFFGFAINFVSLFNNRDS